MAQPSVEVKVVREVDLGQVTGEALKWFLGKALLDLSNMTTRRAPVEFGKLRGSLEPGGSPVTGIDSGNPPKWAKLGTNTEYAQPLNNPQTRDPHYQRGEFKGNPTAGWFDKGVKDAVPLVEARVKELAKKIEDGWRA